jgi:hypothetical protein
MSLSIVSLLSELASSSPASCCGENTTSGFRSLNRSRLRCWFAGFGQYYVLPAIKEYRARYPDVSVKLTLSQRVPELYEGSYPPVLPNSQDMSVSSSTR